MKKKFIILITVVILFILGFVIPVLFSSGRTACTMMGCPCVGVEGERPCNSCTRSRPVFNLGLIKTVEKCRGTEIITCKNDKQVDRRVDFSNQECRYDWYAFGINLRYLGNNPGGLREFPTEEREESPEDETANWKESVEKVVEEYESALKTRKRDRVLPYTTGELKKEVQGWPPIFGTSNPHPDGCRVLSSNKLSDSEFEVKARHFEAYTGEGRIGYNDNTYTVEKIGDKYLVGSIEYGEQVEISG